MNTKEINYKGTDIEELYKYALIGADFITEKNHEGITIIDSIKKQLYIRTVLLSRLLDVVNISEDRVMSLEQYKTNNVTVGDFKGKGSKRLKSDYGTFISMLDDEIKNCLEIGNDVTNRFNETVKADMSPENLEVIKKQGEDLLSTINSITDAVKKAEETNE